MSEVQIDSIGIFDEVEEHPDCTVQILKNSVTGEISVGWRGNKRGCEWCNGEKDWSIVDETFVPSGVDPCIVNFCFHCGRKLKERDNE